MARGRKRGFDKDEALDAAMKAFWTNGFEATTYDDLVAASGVNRPSLYAAFGDKAALFEAAVTRYFANYGRTAIAALQGGGTLKQDISAWLSATADGLARKDHPPGCLVNRTLSEGNGQNRPSKVAQECVAEIEAAVLARIRSAGETGELPPDIDAESLTATIMALHLGMGQLAKTGASAANLRAVADSARLLFAQAEQ